MPVIGRLDEQVDEVLIRPLDKGRSRAPQPQGETPAGDVLAPAPEPPPAQAPERESGRTADELPVWLL